LAFVWEVAMPDFCLSLSSVPGQPELPERLSIAARLGFDAVEIGSPYDVPKERLAEYARGNGLAVVVLDLCEDGNLSSDPARGAEFRKLARRAVDYAQALGALHLRFPARLPPATRAGRPLRETLMRNLRFATETGLSANLRILLDPKGEPEGAAARTADAIAVINDIGARNLSLLCDVGRMQATGESVADVLERFLPRIGHLRIPDFAAAGPESRGLERDTLLSFIDAVGYRGWIGCGGESFATSTPAWLTPYLARTSRTSLWGLPREAFKSTAPAGR
jgi:hydroxypyruvate isomerase